MKVIAFGNRLLRDLKAKSLSEMEAGDRQEIQDAINGALQKLDAVAPNHTKQTTGSIYLEPIMTMPLNVMQGGTLVVGTEFVIEQYGRTVRVDGDPIDNRVDTATDLLFPYAGPTGIVNATVYSDAVPVPVVYSHFLGSMKIMETGRLVVPCEPIGYKTCCEIGEPRVFWIEPTAANQNPPASMLVRFYPIPDRPYRLSFDVLLAPARIEFLDLLTDSKEIPLRPEHVELYLLPIARSLMTSSSLWEDTTTKAAVVNAAEKAEADYVANTTIKLFTPTNRVGTTQGY